MDTGILDKVWKLTIDAGDPHMDGFYTFEKKKTLMLIKKVIDNELPKLPFHAGEVEWMIKNGIIPTTTE